MFLSVEWTLYHAFAYLFIYFVFVGAKSERWLKTKLRSLIVAKEKQQLLKNEKIDVSASSNGSSDQSESSLHDLEKEISIVKVISEEVLEPESKLEETVDSENREETVELCTDVKDTVHSENEQNIVEMCTDFKDAIEETACLKNGHNSDREFESELDEKVNTETENDLVTQDHLNLDLKPLPDSSSPAVIEKMEDIVSPVTESAEDALNYISSNSSEAYSEELNECVSFYAVNHRCS